MFPESVDSFAPKFDARDYPVPIVENVVLPVDSTNGYLEIELLEKPNYRPAMDNVAVASQGVIKFREVKCLPKLAGDFFVDYRVGKLKFFDDGKNGLVRGAAVTISYGGMGTAITASDFQEIEEAVVRVQQYILDSEESWKNDLSSTERILMSLPFTNFVENQRVLLCVVPSGHTLIPTKLVVKGVKEPVNFVFSGNLSLNAPESFIARFDLNLALSPNRLAIASLRLNSEAEIGLYCEANTEIYLNATGHSPNTACMVDLIGFLY